MADLSDLIANGTPGGDSLVGVPEEFVAGLGGADRFLGIPTLDVVGQTLLGGGDNDFYLAAAGSIVIVAEASGSSDDLVEALGLSNTADSSFIVEIDGRHLTWLDIATESIVVIVDWRVGDNQVETIAVANQTNLDLTTDADVIASSRYVGEVSAEEFFDDTGIDIGAMIVDAREARTEAEQTEAAERSTIEGTNGADTLKGTSGAESIIGLGGNDEIRGLASNDFISGDGGKDTINGNGGDDRIEGGAGNDKLFGDGGDDSLFGDAGKDKINGGGGSDIIIGGAGNDTLAGNNGNDGIDGGAGNDRINGGGGKDNISGGDGDDVIGGQGGRDIIHGGLGADTLDGGGGRDMFVYDSLDDAGDVINGFLVGTRGDAVVLLDIIDDTGDVAPHLDDIVRLVDSGDDTILQVKASDQGNFEDLATLSGLADSTLVLSTDGADLVVMLNA